MAATPPPTSTMPYPSKKAASPTGPTTGSVAVAPNCLNWRAKSPGMASAPEPHTRTDVRSRFSAPASNIIRYMAGTPTKIVERRDSMASRTSTGRNRGSR